MEQGEFHRVRGRVLDLYREGHFRDALQVALEAQRRFPEKEAETSYWIACLKCRLSDLEGAIRTLAEALERGHWWVERWLLADPDLEPIRDRPEFRKIVAESRRRKALAQEKAKPELFAFPPLKGRERPPLLITLHWLGGTAEGFAPYWEAAREAGFLVAVPQSSQVVSEDGYCWDDRDLAVQEIAAHWEQLKQDYALDLQRVILAGASQGGRLAIEIVLAGEPIPARGLIAVVPAIREPEELTACAEKAAKRGLRGWILTGEHDHFRPGAKRLCEFLREKGAPCEFVVIPGLGHDFPVPEDFGTRLPSAIEFVSGKR